jgi:hypothetical protein
MNNKKAAANQVTVESTQVSRYGTLVRLSLDKKPGSDKALLIYAKHKSGDVRELLLDTVVPQEELYYVYARGGLYSVTSDPTEAVLLADEQMGVVLNRRQQYIWERGNKKAKYQMNLEDVPEAVLTRSWDRKALQEELGDSAVLVDLSGCPLDNVLYEVSSQRAVIAKTSEEKSVVIIGYDPYNTWLYDPEKKEVYPYGIKDSTALFEKAGNIFLSYVENPGER